jgi:hypothetical protein
LSSFHREPFPTEHITGLPFACENAIKAHENIIWVISLEEGATNIIGGNVKIFMSKNGGLNKDGIRGNSEGGGLMTSSLAIYLHCLLMLAQPQAFILPKRFSVRNMREASALRLS